MLTLTALTHKILADWGAGFPFAVDDVMKFVPLMVWVTLLGIVKYYVAPVARDISFMRAMLGDFPPHRHTAGKIIYPKGMNPKDSEQDAPHPNFRPTE